MSAPWQSTNLDEAPIEDRALILVTVRDMSQGAGADRPVMADFTAYLETELNALRRFPVKSFITGTATQIAAEELAALGDLNLNNSGSPQGEDVVYVLEYEALAKHMVYTDQSLNALRTFAGALHEYWYEGIANFYRLKAGRMEPLWGDRTFRSRSQWVMEFQRLDGSRRGGHDSTNTAAVKRLYDRCRSSILFRLTKELYSKIGRSTAIDGVLRSGDEVLVSVPIGSKEGVMTKQPMFLTYKSGSMQIFLAKAIADSVTSDTATLRIVGWNTPDERAEAMSQDPEGFFARNAGRIVARTEGLAMPPEWSERGLEIDRMMGYIGQDEEWIGYLPSGHQEELLDLVRSR